jgi:hypothetical protein
LSGGKQKLDNRAVVQAGNSRRTTYTVTFAE